MVVALISGSILVFLLAVWALKGTVLDVRYQPWALILYFDLLLIVMPLPIVYTLGIENVPIIFAAQPGIEGEVAFYVFAVLVAYLVSLGIFLRAFALRARVLTVAPSCQLGKVYRLAIALSVYGIILMIVFYGLGMKHAFLTAFITGKPLLPIRLENAYASNVPSQIASLLPLVGYLVAAFGGYLGRVNGVRGIALLFFSLLILSMGGDKAPVAWGLIIWILGKSFLLRRRVRLRRLLIAVALIVFLALPLVYWAASLQIPGMTLKDFATYLFLRLGVGQMAGIYETFGLIKSDSLPEGDFYWHMVPLASFFVDYLDYQKMLMMVTEGYEVTEMGVKNSFFIAEAYAIGGWMLVVLSPFIVAFSTAVGILFLKALFNKFVDPHLSQEIALLIYLKTHSITGGLASFPMFKGLILVVLQILAIWLPVVIISKLLNVLMAIFKSHTKKGKDYKFYPS